MFQIDRVLPYPESVGYKEWLLRKKEARKEGVAEEADRLNAASLDELSVESLDHKNSSRVRLRNALPFLSKRYGSAVESVTAVFCAFHVTTMRTHPISDEQT